MDLERLKELVEFLETKDFVEVEYENQGVRLRLRRAEPEVRANPAPPSKVQQDLPVSSPLQRVQPEHGEIFEEGDYVTVESPIVGTFYRAPSPEADPFVEDGETVEKGQVLCIIEAMKVMNEIESEVKGRVKSVLVENGQPVGYGDPLFVIEALRIIRTCKEMGIGTVSIYSLPDKDSLHVRYADEAVCVGPAESNLSYLNVTNIISAAEITDCEAIHPGYGFLAENADFADMCESCKIKFIGPSPAIIRAMGDKANARRLMSDAGVKVLPGSQGGIEDTGELLKTADDIGFPLIIKAVAGGGGRGMRVCHNELSLKNNLTTAQSEARAAFGDPRLYLEKYAPRAKHVEFQVLGDQHGNIIHLGERDCTVQRRHQKLIEESPSPALDDKLRVEMGRAALKAAKAVGYMSTGTIEFLLDYKGEFYFLEMNTRIQVEHSVTEMVLDLDMVKEQIRVAAGEELSLLQQHMSARGHSIECRVCAEDPVDFAPQPGKITALHLPGGNGVRVDSLLHTDCYVLPYYDSLIAKIIVKGRDRHDAIQKMIRALEETYIEGIKTNIPYLMDVLTDKEFVAGSHSIQGAA
jgi:acetyl-CoA carboxylase biotin carboxylase subunit